MIKPEQVPTEVVKAYIDCCADNVVVTYAEAIAAALNAWPNQHVIDDDVVYIQHGLILPLPQETQDD